MLARLFVFGLLAALAAGCSASVDPDTGQVATDRVWFDQNGNAHCPHPDCAPAVALEPALKSDEGVELHKSSCFKDHPVTWSDETVLCWACDGGGTCPLCRGSGQSGKDRCSGCLRLEGESGETRFSSNGLCGECGGKGTVRFPAGA